jgi:hypothetical protein
MWICTTGKGIYEVTYSGEIIRYDENNGLSGNRYRTITELSDNTMLAAGDTGLSYIVDEVSKSRWRSSQGKKRRRALY